MSADPVGDLVEADPSGALPAAGPALVDGEPVRMPLCVAVDGDEVALWQFDLAGHPCGAWTYTDDGSVEVAERILGLCHRRAFLPADPDNDLGLLTELGRRAGATVGDLGARTLHLRTALGDIIEARRTYEQAVRTAAEDAGKTYAPLVWDVPVPAADTQNAQVVDAFSARRKAARPHVADALTGVSAARGLLGAWSDTEGKRTRRKYLVGQFGPAQALPPSWRSTLRQSYDR